MNVMGSATGTQSVIRSSFQKDTQSLLHIIEHVLSESMYIKDIAGAIQAG